MAFEVNVNVNFPALDKIATLLCMNSEGIVDKAVKAFAAASQTVKTPAEAVEVKAEEVVEQTAEPVAELEEKQAEAAVEPKKRTRKAKVVEPVVENVVEAEPAVEEPREMTNGEVAVMTEEIMSGKPFPPEPEPMTEEPVKAEEPDAFTVAPEPVVSEHDYTIAELSHACMKLRDKDPAALEQARGLFTKYEVNGLAALKGDQKKMNSFAADLRALGAEL